MSSIGNGGVDYSRINFQQARQVFETPRTPKEDSVAQPATEPLASVAQEEQLATLDGTAAPVGDDGPPPAMAPRSEQTAPTATATPTSQPQATATPQRAERPMVEQQLPKDETAYAATRWGIFKHEGKKFLIHLAQAGLHLPAAAMALTGGVAMGTAGLLSAPLLASADKEKKAIPLSAFAAANTLLVEAGRHAISAPTKPLLSAANLIGRTALGTTDSPLNGVKKKALEVWTRTAGYTYRKAVSALGDKGALDRTPLSATKNVMVRSSIVLSGDSLHTDHTDYTAGSQGQQKRIQGLFRSISKYINNF